VIVQPLVSCILATRNRRRFLGQAIRYFLHQRYEHKELILIDDSSEPIDDLVPAHEQIRHLRLPEYTNVGAKLNLGIQHARGAIIQKLDDDDYYHPDFLPTTVQLLQSRGSASAVVGSDCFLVLIAATGALKFSGHGWCAGGTLCFFKQLWEQRPFRDLPRAIDWWFLKDNAPERIKLQNPELYILVRHADGHLWNTLGKGDVSAYFRRQPNYSRALGDIVAPADYAFYERLRAVAAVGSRGA